MHFTVMSRNRDMLERDDGAEVLADISQLDGRGCFSHRASTARERTNRLINTAARSIPPRTNWNQSASIPAIAGFLAEPFRR